MALKGNQKKLDKNNNNRIDAQDFKILKAEKAKGRGMGLQDEKVKPGKVMKAKRGQFSKSSAGTTAKNAMGKTFSGYQKAFKTAVSAGEKARATSTIIGLKPKLPEAAKSSKLARRALKAAQATRLGKMLLPVVAAGVAGQQYLKSKMKKDKNKKTLKDFREQKKPGVPSEKTKTINSALNKLNKKMGGGMMNKPMGYNTGVFASKEDRKKAEKNIKQARSKEGLRSFLSSGNKINQPMRKERYMEGRKARHSAFKKKLGRTAAGIASSLNPVTTAARVIGKVMGKGSKKRDFQKGDYGDISVKKMGGGMMKVPGYVSGTDKTVTIKDGRIALTDPDTPKAGPKAGRPKAPPPPRKRRLPQQVRRSAGRAGLGALGGSGNKSETINLMKNKIYKYKAKKDSGFTDKQVSMQKDIKEKSYKRKSGEKRLGKIYSASPTILSKAGMTGSKRSGMPGHSIMTTSSKGKTKLNYVKPYGGTIETGFKGYDERTPGVGLKTGKSIKVKCKLGRNKPTKMY